MTAWLSLHVYIVTHKVEDGTKSLLAPSTGWCSPPGVCSSLLIDLVDEESEVSSGQSSVCGTSPSPPRYSVNSRPAANDSTDPSISPGDAPCWPY